MTYAELIDRLFVEYGDETEKIHGEPVSLIYLIGQVGEKQGYESGAERDDAFIDAREPFAFVFDAYCSEVLAACKNRYRGITRQGIQAIEMELLGFSSKEIAGRYGTTVNNINAWISRARKKLKTDGDFLKALS